MGGEGRVRREAKKTLSFMHNRKLAQILAYFIPFT
jgi:hypothetical protein